MSKRMTYGRNFTYRPDDKLPGGWVECDLVDQRGAVEFTFRWAGQTASEVVAKAILSNPSLDIPDDSTLWVYSEDRAMRSELGPDVVIPKDRRLAIIYEPNGRSQAIRAANDRARARLEAEMAEEARNDLELERERIRASGKFFE